MGPLQVGFLEEVIPRLLRLLHAAFPPSISFVAGLTSSCVLQEGLLKGAGREMAAKVFESIGKLGLGLAVAGGVVNSALYNGEREKPGTSSSLGVFFFVSILAALLVRCWRWRGNRRAALLGCSDLTQARGLRGPFSSRLSVSCCSREQSQGPGVKAASSLQPVAPKVSFMSLVSSSPRQTAALPEGLVVDSYSGWQS